MKSCPYRTTTLEDGTVFRYGRTVNPGSVRLSPREQFTRHPMASEDAAFAAVLRLSGHKEDVMSFNWKYGRRLIPD